VLLTLRGSGELRAVERLDRAIRPLLPATTSLSAALLVAAADGYAAPEVVALVDQLGTGPGPTDGSALDRVLAIGHTSGSDLVSGMAGTIRALRSAIHAQPKETLHA
jgi:hypothetical protein